MSNWFSSSSSAQRLGWPDSSADSLFCLPLRARCTAQPFVGILIFFPKNTNLFTSSCLGLSDRQAIWVRFSILRLLSTIPPVSPPAGSHDISLIPTSAVWGADPPRGCVPTTAWFGRLSFIFRLLELLRSCLDFSRDGSLYQGVRLNGERLRANVAALKDNDVSGRHPPDRPFLTV